MALKKDEQKIKSSIVHIAQHDCSGEFPMLKVIILFWLFRDNTTVLSTLVEKVEKAVELGHQEVFDKVEFFLPQLVHLIIHCEAIGLPASTKDGLSHSPIESLALAIADKSMHFALQFYWYLLGSLEDYLPELPDGSSNSRYKPELYYRCVQMLSSLTLCVTHGRHSNREYPQQKQGSLFGGFLEYKESRKNEKDKENRNESWRALYFNIENGMLQCYENEKDALIEHSYQSLIRSIPLDGARLSFQHDEKERNGNTLFSVENWERKFLLKAKNEDSVLSWKRKLEEQSNIIKLTDSSNSNNVNKIGLPQKEVQENRYDFFRSTHSFYQKIIEINDSLRDEIHTSKREALAESQISKLQLPSCLYIPICNSSQSWEKVDRLLSSHVRLFTTSERCLSMIHCVTKRGEENGFKSETKDNALPSSLHGCNDDIYGSTNVSTLDYDAFVQRQEKMLSIFDYLNSKFDNSTGKISNQAEREVKKEKKYNRKSVLDSDDPITSSSISLEGEQSSISTPKTISSDNASFSSSSSTISSQAQKLPGNSLSIDDISDTFSIKSSDSANASHTGVAQKDIYGLPCESWAAASSKMLEESTGDNSGDTKNSNGGGSGSIIESVSPFMIKKYRFGDTDADVRQEAFVMQMIYFYQSLFQKAGLQLWLKPFYNLCIGKYSCIMEVLKDAMTIQELKEHHNRRRGGRKQKWCGLRKYFEATYGAPNSESFQKAQTNFIQSLAGYAVVSYILGIKDRHNANIMIDSEGHIIHLDFNQIFGLTPGKSISKVIPGYRPERNVPFKLTKEYVEVMGGVNSSGYKEFQTLFVQGFFLARQNWQCTYYLVEMMWNNSQFPCFTQFSNAKDDKNNRKRRHKCELKWLKDRFLLETADEMIREKALALIDKSYKHVGTFVHDFTWNARHAILGN